jgi:putative endonuclease
VRIARALRPRLCFPSRPSTDAVLADQPEGADSRASLGLWGEQVAADFLKAHGFRIVGRRVRVGRHDELDLIAVPSGGRVPQLVFVEVKTRRSPDFGGPIAAVNRRKRHALCRAAAHYLRRLPSPGSPFRFDVVEVIGLSDGRPPVIRHTENAFPMEARYVTPWLSGRRHRI